MVAVGGKRWQLEGVVVGPGITAAHVMQHPNSEKWLVLTHAPGLDGICCRIALRPRSNRKPEVGTPSFDQQQRLVSVALMD